MSTEPKIELWFVRHGESKNNAILKSALGLGTVSYPFKFEQDPHITQKGIDVATENGKRLINAGAKFDLVLSSAMVRTIETSYYMFVKSKLTQKIHIVPYISEIPLSFAMIPIYENIPLKRRNQIKKLGKLHDSELLDSVDFSLVGGPDGNNKKLLPPNGDKFLEWLYGQQIVKDLLSSSAGSTDKIRIAVVTHSHFLMKKDTLHLKKKPSNADIWTATLHSMAGGVLTLTDLQGWYEERVDNMGKKLDKKIHKTEKKATKKHTKYQAKINQLGAALPEDDLEEELEADSDQEGDKREKKEKKYQRKMAKKEAKYAKKKEKLEHKKEQFVNVSDIQTQQLHEGKLE